MSTRDETSTTAAKFRALLVTAKSRGGKDYPRRTEYLGTFSDGTRYMVEYGSRDLEFYLVTDLTTPERRVGRTSVTIALNTQTSTTLQTLSPILADATLTNYRLFPGPINQFGVSIALFLNSTAQLKISAARGLNNAQAASTGVTVTGPDLLDVDFDATPPHGSDSGLFGHGHMNQSHPVNDPTHPHPLNVNAAVITFNVDWLIWHI